jgi:hypothetical protein
MNPKHRGLLLGALAWFGAIWFLADRGTFVNAPDRPPAMVGIAFAAPILLFLVAIAVSPAWRNRVVSVPPMFLIALNGWRFIGLGFVMAWVEGLLPGGFAWPAGLGDITMAVTAPLVAARVAADDGFRFRGPFLAWNLFGIADFVDAVFLGTVHSWSGSGATVTTALMQRLPFALIPCFFVPLVAMAHIVLLLQRRRSR